MPAAEPQSAAPGDRTYRVFRLDPRRRVVSAEIIPADSDEQAKAFAQTLPLGHGIELWERARLLARYHHAEAGTQDGPHDPRAAERTPSSRRAG